MDEFRFSEDVVTKLQFIHDSNQLLESFVSRVIWPSAQGLCEYFTKHRDLIKGKRIIELGSGTGLCGITLAHLGAEKVVLTDFDEKSTKLLQANTELNHLEDKCSVLQLTWGSQLEQFEGNTFDIVVGSDVVYEPECVNPLLTSGKAAM